MTDSGSNRPMAEASLNNYFREQLDCHARDLDPAPTQDTRWYLCEMLVRFCQTDHLFSFDEDERRLRPLALLYADAQEAQNDWERCLLLRQLGDVALFLGAVFPERFRSRGIQEDYLIGMGGGAYDYLADHAPHHRHVYQELANRFARLLELVATVCSRDTSISDEAILAIYQRWTRSRDPKLAQQLEALGITLPPDHTVH